MALGLGSDRGWRLAPFCGVMGVAPPPDQELEEVSRGVSHHTHTPLPARCTVNAFTVYACDESHREVRVCVCVVGNACWVGAGGWSRLSRCVRERRPLPVRYATYIVCIQCKNVCLHAHNSACKVRTEYDTQTPPCKIHTVYMAVRSHREGVCTMQGRLTSTAATWTTATCSKVGTPSLL